jgi:hypothetical protein
MGGPERGNQERLLRPCCAALLVGHQGREQQVRVVHPDLRSKVGI